MGHFRWAIKANGEVLKHFVILKGKTLNASWMLGEADRWLVKGWSFAASNKGWSN